MDCPICLDHLTDVVLNQITSCQHTFHASCLLEWTRHNNSCPICRTRFGNILTKANRQEIETISRNNSSDLYVPLPFIDISFADLTIENDNEDQPLMNNYSFALEPERPQPSGTQNRSRIRLNYLTVPFNMFPESYVPSGPVNGARVFT
jgi:hypothetical protein